MLDIKLVRERADFVRQRLATRGAGDEAQIQELLRLDEERRRLLAEVEALKAQRHRASKEIGALIGQKKIEEAETKKRKTRELGDRIGRLDKLAGEAETARGQLMLRLPNLPHESVPVGKSAQDNPVVRVHGQKPAFSFKPKSHVELCESLKLVDFERAAKLSGSGFVLFTNLGAKLERALIQFMLDLHTSEHGYTEVSPPLMVGPQCLEGVGQFPKFADQYYAVQEGLDASTLGKLYLVPTAETPVANIHRQEILPERVLPICYCAYTPCFRGETGAAPPWRGSSWRSSRTINRPMAASRFRRPCDLTSRPSEFSLDPDMHLGLVLVLVLAIVIQKLERRPITETRAISNLRR